MKKVLLFLLLLFSSSMLSAQNYLSLPDTVWIAVTSSHTSISSDMENQFAAVTQASLEKVNQRKKQKIRFLLTEDTARADLHVKLTGFYPPTDQQKQTAFLLSVVGLGTPLVVAFTSGVILPIAVFFTPQSTYQASLQYSPALEALGFVNQEQMVRKVASGYSSLEQKHQGKVVTDFGYYVKRIGHYWNKQHLKALKRLNR